MVKTTKTTTTIDRKKINKNNNNNQYRKPLPKQEKKSLKVLHSLLFESDEKMNENMKSKQQKI